MQESQEISSWQILYTNSADKFLTKLSKRNKKDYEKIKNQIVRLIDEEDILDVKFIINSDDQYRLRVGNYRIIYTRDEQVLIIEIIKIGDRKDVYR